MAAVPVLSFRTPGVRACASSGECRSSGLGRKSSSRNSGNWWAPLFGWSPEPDYIDGGSDTNRVEQTPETTTSGGRNIRFTAFTEEKARQLRMITTETVNFHDVMYHSAIASRLASDFPHRSDR